MKTPKTPKRLVIESAIADYKRRHPLGRRPILTHSKMYCWEEIELRNKQGLLAEYRVWNESSLRASLSDPLTREILENGVVVRLAGQSLGVVLEYRGLYPGTFTVDVLNLDTNNKS